MSRLTLILLLSGLINVATAFVYLRPRSPAPPAPTAPVATPAAPASVEPADLPLDASTWAALQASPAAVAGPTATLVDHLRAAGFPLDVIRAIVRQQLDDEFAPREAAVAAAHATTHYWERDFHSTAGYRNSGPERVALRLEKDARLRELLGDDAETPRERARRERDYGNIPLDQVEKLVTLRTDYDHREIELRNRAQGILFPSDLAELERLRTERQAAIDALFTPDERATYELHAGDISNDLRARLRWFQPSETEFLNLYTAQAEFDHAFAQAPDRTTTTPEAVQAWNDARAAAQTQLDADFAAALGPERYADYQLTASPTYARMRGITDRYDLPAELAAAMTRSHDAVMAEVNLITADPALSPADRAARADALARESTAAITDQIPPAALTAFERTTQQQVQQVLRPVRRVVPAPPPAAAPAPTPAPGT